MATDQSEDLLDCLKRVTAILREADIPFVLGGGLAAWARGGPPTEHDIDLVIRHEDAEHALDACAVAGLRTAVPPEGWLVKVWDDEILVDLIFRPTGLDVDDAFANSEMLNVHAVAMPVLAVDDLFVTKLLALTEHNLDYAPVLEYARSLREQIDWRSLQVRTAGSPFARAFFTLVEALGVCDWKPGRVAGAAQAQSAATEASEAAEPAALRIAHTVRRSGGA